MQTAKEVLEAIKALPADQLTAINTGILDIIRPQAQTLGVVIRTTAEDQTHTDNQVRLKSEQAIEAGFNQKFKEHNDKYDALILKLTGIEKKPYQPNASNEKTSEYLERAVAEAKVNGTTADAKKVKELQDQIIKINDDYAKAIAEEKSKSFLFKKNSLIDADLATRTIVVPAHITDEKEKQDYIKTAKDSLKLNFLAKYDVKEDGENLLWLNKADGKPLLDGTTDGKNLTASDLIGKDFKAWFVPNGIKQEGTGGKTKEEQGGTFKTKEEVHAHLKSQGMKEDSQEYFDSFEKITKESGIKV